MAKLKLASSAATFLFFCFLSLSSALASSFDTPEVTSNVAPRDTPYDELIVLPSANSKQTTVLPDIESEESSSVPVNENLFAVDLTEAKEVDTDDLPGSVPLKEVPFHHHHHHHHHRPGRSGRKEISYGNDMILSSHEGFGNSGFEEDEGFGEEDGGLRKFHHNHHHHHRHHHRFDHGEVEGVEDEKEGHPHDHWFHQRNFLGDEEHPFRHGEVEGAEDEKEGHPHGHWFRQRKFGGDEEHRFRHGFHHHRRHHHHHHHHEEEEHEEGGLLFKLRKILNGF